MSDTLIYSLQIAGQNPKDNQYNYFVAGGGFSLIVIAAFSELVFKKRNKFFPLFVWLLITLSYQITNFTLSLFT